MASKSGGPAYAPLSTAAASPTASTGGGGGGGRFHYPAASGGSDGGSGSGVASVSPTCCCVPVPAFMLRTVVCAPFAMVHREWAQLPTRKQTVLAIGCVLMLIM